MPPIRTGPLGRLSLTRKERQNLRVGLLFISPWIVGFLAFLVYPIFYTLRISFTQYTGFGEPKWIGLGNYQTLLNDELFWTRSTTRSTTPRWRCHWGRRRHGAGPGHEPAVPEVPIYRAILYLPSIIPLFALSFIFLILMNPTQGIFNQLLIASGSQRQLVRRSGLDEARLRLHRAVRRRAGGPDLPGRSERHPVTLYEAAMLDGAGAWSRFRNITLPMMTPVILYDLILG